VKTSTTWYSRVIVDLPAEDMSPLSCSPGIQLSPTRLE
jgi:hypothetical protein